MRLDDPLATDARDYDARWRRAIHDLVAWEPLLAPVVASAPRLADLLEQLPEWAATWLTEEVKSD